MKVIYEHSIGGDGAIAGLYLENGMLVEKVSYPLSKAVEPAKAFINARIDSLEEAIPGDWDKAILEPIRAGAMTQIDKLIADL